MTGTFSFNNRATLQEDELFMGALDSKFQDGLTLHRQGKIAEAQQIYLEVLRYDPHTYLLCVYLD